MSREIVESDLFQAQREAISPDVRRMDDILDGLFWALHENAEQFFRVFPDRNLWLAKTDPFPGSPTLRVWFSLSVNEVLLLSIERGDTFGEEAAPESQRIVPLPRARRTARRGNSPPGKH
jgi:hypothetical protein